MRLPADLTDGLRWGTIVLALVRVLISIRHFTIAWLLTAGVLNADGTDPMVSALAAIPFGNLLMWTGYMAAYLAVAVLLAFRLRIAIVPAVIAFLLDFVYWALIVVLPIYTSVYTAGFTIGDILINATSVLVLVGSGLYFGRGAR